MGINKGARVTIFVTAVAMLLTACTGISNGQSLQSSGAELSATKAAAQGPGLLRYKLAPGSLVGGDIFPVARARQPTQVSGVLAMPAGEGPFPVAVVLHGQHAQCENPKNFGVAGFAKDISAETWPLVCRAEQGYGGTGYLRHEDGLSYLTEQLARQGVASISIDLNASSAFWGGMTDRSKAVEALVQTHLGLLQSFNSGDNKGLDLPQVKGKFDLTKLAYIGHSQSGGFVAESVASGSQPNLKAAVLLQPIDPILPPVTSSVPTLLVRGSCDEDVKPESGLESIAKLNSEGGVPAYDLLIQNAGHAMMNTNLEGTSCPGKIDPGVARNQAAVSISGFVASILAGKAPVVPQLEGGESVLTAIGQTARPQTPKVGEPAPYLKPQQIKMVESGEAVLPPLPPAEEVMPGDPIM